MANSKIAKAKAYECVDCGYLTKDKNNSIIHSRMPIVEIPSGLVIYMKTFAGNHPITVEDCSIVNHKSEKPSQSNHGFIHAIYSNLKYFKADAYNMNAKEILNSLQNEQSSILSQGQFLEFLDFYKDVRDGKFQKYPDSYRGFAYWNPSILPPEKLIRTTPELEKLISW
jgi:hypothetical protein